MEYGMFLIIMCVYAVFLAYMGYRAMAVADYLIDEINEIDVYDPKFYSKLNGLPSQVEMTLKFWVWPLSRFKID